MTLEPIDSMPKDFDFIIGNWRVHHRRLKARLCGCSEWVEFEGLSETRKVLGGFGNLEDNYLAFPEGSFRAVALRSFNSKSKQWAIWWLDGRNPGEIDKPVVGQFSGTTGVFFADDVLNGKPIKVRFTWSALKPDLPRWEQAFSADGEATWETNWTMEFIRNE